MQLVLINKRIVAHGEGFIAMGGVVINTETGKKYEHATIAECSGCPSDIDKVGYEYHAGTFVPCAPYGIGQGNVAVLCNEDCKSIKDSGISFEDIYYKINHTVVTGTYEGLYENVGSSSGKSYGDVIIPMPGRAKAMFIVTPDKSVFAMINGENGQVDEFNNVTVEGSNYKLAAKKDNATATISDTEVKITVAYRTSGDFSKLALKRVTYQFVALF